jgi:anti-sigma-K factor RskA
MSFHSKNRKNWPTVEKSPYHNDEVDVLVRRALQNSVAGEEPSPEVWHRIKTRLEQQRARSHPRKRKVLVAQFSWLVQLLVLGIIVLVVLGLSVSQGFDFSLDHEYVVNGTLTPQANSEEAAPLSTDDHMLSRYYLFQAAKKLTVFDHRLAP